MTSHNGISGSLNVAGPGCKCNRLISPSIRDTLHQYEDEAGILGLAYEMGGKPA